MFTKMCEDVLSCSEDSSSEDQFSESSDTQHAPRLCKTKTLHNVCAFMMSGIIALWSWMSFETTRIRDVDVSLRAHSNRMLNYASTRLCQYDTHVVENSMPVLAFLYGFPVVMFLWCGYSTYIVNHFYTASVTIR